MGCSFGGPSKLSSRLELSLWTLGPTSPSIDHERGISFVSDFPLDGEDVSRSHAYLLRTPQGFLLVDSSLHGTYVNGERIQAQRILAGGDLLEIAGHTWPESSWPLWPSTCR